MRVRGGGGGGVNGMGLLCGWNFWYICFHNVSFIMLTEFCCIIS